MRLIIDTSTSKALLALEDEGRLDCRQFEPRGTQKAVFSALADMVKGDVVDRLTGIISGLGPGSFTGVKMGVMAAKALAWSKKIPLTGVGSMDSVAAITPEPSLSESVLLVVVPSTRWDVYLGVYEWKNGQWTSDGTIRDEKIASFEKNIILCDRPAIITGEAAERIGEILSCKKEVRIMPEELRFPSAAGLLMLAERRPKDGLLNDDPLLITPIYIRASQPERLDQNI